MRKSNCRKLFFIPISLSCLASLIGCNGGGAKGGLNTILVTYDAGDGYFNDGIVKSSSKVLEVRKGVKWSNMSDSEKPKDSEVISNKADDDFEFSKTWKTNVNGVEKFISSTKDFTFTENITLTACYENKKRNFETDSWDTLIEKAESGFTTLKEYYTTSYTNNGDTFVGLTRKLNYGGSDYLVRVIGEKHDDIEVTGSNNKVACLTFEFVNVLPGYSFNVFESSNRYNGSSIQKALNNEVKNNIQSFDTSHLQVAKKKTYKKTSTDTEGSIEISKEQVFIPSLNELNITADPNGNQLIADDETEGETYQYFIANSEDEMNANRSKKYLPSGSSTGIDYAYWTRTLDVSDSMYSSAWTIYTDGKCGFKDTNDKYQSLDVSKSIGFAPCFCIGITDSEKYNFETDSWDNIIATANQGYPALVKRYSKDYQSAKDKVELKDGSSTVATVYRKPANSFVGLTHKLNILDDNNNYEEYTVRVIGENHDFTYNPQKSTDDSNKKRAALTFQLTRDYSKKTIWDNRSNGWFKKSTEVIHSGSGTANFYYGDSTISHNLSGYDRGGTGTPRWDKPLIDRIKFSDEATSPDGSAYIKEVQKQTHQMSDGGSTKTLESSKTRENQTRWHKGWTAGYVSEKLFPLNTFENGAEKYFVLQEKVDNDNVITLNNNFAEQGYAYEYYDYEKIYTPTTHVENVLLPELTERRKSDSTTSYTTSLGSYFRQAVSIALSNTDCSSVVKQIVTWNMDGTYKAWEGNPETERYVRPAFCIGETLESTLKEGGYIA